MATLTANITSSATVIPVSAEVENGHYTIDDEAIYVHGMSRGADGRDFDRLSASVDRGLAGTTPASHSSGATLTRYYPDAASAMGGLTNPITEAVSVNPASDSDDYLLLVKAPEDYENGFGEMVQVQNFDGHTIFGVNVFGQVDVGGSTAARVRITDTTAEAPTALLNLSPGTDGQGFIRAVGATEVFQVLSSGAVVIGAIAAPADGDLSASQVAIWFDATNGAAKVKFKGKSANGTIVTGEVALT